MEKHKALPNAWQDLLFLLDKLSLKKLLMDS